MSCSTLTAESTAAAAPDLIAVEPLWLQKPAEIAAWCANEKVPKFRATQLVEWLFTKRVISLDQMSNLPKQLRERLASAFAWELPTLISRLDSEDGASKLLLESQHPQQPNRKHVIEAVILRYEGRTSLCVSSQVGCRLACTFCQTGKLGFMRHLTAGEILAQFYMANAIVAPEGRRITHVVFMGMGEPLDNFAPVVRAVSQMTDPECLGLSPRRVTVSTSGVASRIQSLAAEVSCSLAISLHAPRDELRTQMMPINRRYPLAELKKELQAYQAATDQGITIEYILIKDLNCGLREARELVQFLQGLRQIKINLIPFNAHPGLEFQTPEAAEIRAFQSHLAKCGYPSPVRYSKGLGVSAACGQLAAKHQDRLQSPPERRQLLAG